MFSGWIAIRNGAHFKKLVEPVPSLSIVIPAFNEEAAIARGNLALVANWLHENIQESELIVVNDGSEDQTEKLASEVAERVVTIPHCGKAAAIMAGIREAKGDVVLFSDMDLDTPITEASKLLDAISGGADVAIGSRGQNRPGAPLHRRFLSGGHTFLRKLLLNLDLSDTQCGFKAFKREAALRILDEMRIYRAGSMRSGTDYSVNSGFDLEFLFVARRLEYRVDEIPVQWKYSQGGRVLFFREALRGLFDLLKIANTY